MAAWGSCFSGVACLRGPAHREWETLCVFAIVRVKNSQQRKFMMVRKAKRRKHKLHETPPAGDHHCFQVSASPPMRLPDAAGTVQVIHSLCWVPGTVLGSGNV